MSLGNNTVLSGETCDQKGCSNDANLFYDMSTEPKLPIRLCSIHSEKLSEFRKETGLEMGEAVEEYEGINTGNSTNRGESDDEH